MTTETEEERKLGALDAQPESQEVVSYGIHRYSTATRLIITIVMVAFCSTALFFALQMLIDLYQGIDLAANAYLVMALAAFLAAALGAVVGLFTARGITKPLARVTSTLSEIKSGNYSARTEFTGYDEIGRLGSTLDEMADTIERNAEYERQITVDVAHELRTPLMAMQANLEAMIDGVMPTDAEHLVTVNTEVVRLGRLVEGQLKLSRLEARKVEFVPRRLNLSELVTRLVSNYQLLIESSGLVLDIAAQPGVFVFADSDMLRQAAANLISNAVRYTPEGGVIRVFVRAKGKTAELEVADTGIGISREDLENIFEKFWRAEDDRNRDQGGLGIGLSLVREIVKINGGRIAVHSKLGLGSQFTIILPLGKAGGNPK